MKNVFLITLLMICAVTSQAQVKGQFAPAIVGGGAVYNSRVRSNTSTVYVAGLRLRLVGDYKRIQFGGGLDISSLNSTSPNLNTYDPFATDFAFVCPQIFVHYKFPFKNKPHYVVAGIAVGTGISTDEYIVRPFSGLTGLDVGAVFRISKRVDVEVTESLRMLNSTAHKYQTYYFTSGADREPFNTYLLTTNVGIRLNRAKHR